MKNNSRNSTVLILLVFAFLIISPLKAYANIDCGELSRKNPTATILCQGEKWSQGNKVDSQKKISIPDFKIEKDTPGYYKITEYEKRKDADGKEFVAEGVTRLGITKKSLLSEKYFLEKQIKEKKQVPTVTFVGNVSANQAEETKAQVEREYFEEKARLNAQLAVINSYLEKIESLEASTSQNTTNNPKNAPNIKIPEFSVQKESIPSIYLNSDGSWKYPNDAERYKPGYEFTFYKTEKDINGIEHRVVSKKVTYTTEGLKNERERLVAIRDPLNSDALEEKQITFIDEMLKKIEELEK